MTNSLPVTEKNACHCGCGSQDLPVLDVLSIPAPIRHAAILGTLKFLPSGASFAIKAHHDPTPLLAQLRTEFANEVDAEYLQEGPENWIVKLTKVS